MNGRDQKTGPHPTSTHSTASGQDALVDDVLKDKYRIVERLGVGNTGIVYLAELTTTGRKRGIKVYLRDIVSTPTREERFLRIAKSLKSLSHLNIAAIKDFGIERDRPFVVTDYLKGSTLREQVASGPMGPKDLYSIAEQTLRALVFAHEQGFVHEDLKPHNIALVPQPDGSFQVRLRDLGVARYIVAENSDGGSTLLTITGKPFGTPDYLSPEQTQGLPAGRRADLYSVAVIFFEMLTGHPPFRGERGDIAEQHVNAARPRLREKRPELKASPELDAFIQHAMAKDPGHRFQDALEMLKALEALKKPLERALPVSRRPSLTPVPTPAPQPPPLPAETSASEADSVFDELQAPASKTQATQGVAKPPPLPRKTLREPDDFPPPPPPPKTPKPPPLQSRGSAPPPAPPKTPKPTSPKSAVEHAVKKGDEGQTRSLKRTSKPAQQMESKKSRARVGVFAFLVTLVVAGIPTTLYLLWDDGDSAPPEERPTPSEPAEVPSKGVASADLQPRPNAPPDVRPVPEPAKTDSPDGETVEHVEEPPEAVATNEEDMEFEPEPEAEPRDNGRSRPEIDELLGIFASKLENGEPPGDENIKGLRAFALKADDDARPLLLLARYRISRGHYTDGLDRYELAYDIDPQARRDTAMMTNLVKLSKSRTVGGRAALMVKRMYGREAIEPVKRALNDQGLEQSEAKNLQRLLKTLQRLPE